MVVVVGELGPGAAVFALKLYAEKYKAVAMYGDTPMMERNTAIQAFKTPNSGASPVACVDSSH